MDNRHAWQGNRADLAVMNDPVAERDNLSFEDSERFEGDSECSFGTSSESINTNWLGWSFQQPNEPIQSGFVLPTGRYSSSSTNTVVAQHGPHRPKRAGPASLSELAARACARSLSFDQLEEVYKEVIHRNQDPVSLPVSYSIPEKLFLSIIYWCFPTTEDDIRLYSVLSNANEYEVNAGESLYREGAVTDVVQIGYLISANVVSQTGLDYPAEGRIYNRSFNVSLRVDRCRIVSCDCSCSPNATWCQHIVALSLYRLLQPNNVQYRPTIWDSVNELPSEKLKKFAQYLINELPREYLPIAQKLLDQLKEPQSDINNSMGAPDPTDGGHEAVPLWHLEANDLHRKIRSKLVNFCIPTQGQAVPLEKMHTPCVQSENDWETLLTSYRSRKPDGLWNLIFIVRELMRRQDGNSVAVLRVITEECLANMQVLMWWYGTKLLQSNEWIMLTNSGKRVDSPSSDMLNAAQLCEELVTLWKYAVLNPLIVREQRMQLFVILQNYHRVTTQRIWQVIMGAGGQETTPLISSAQCTNLMSQLFDSSGASLTIVNARFGMQQFPGFHPALQVCYAMQNEIKFNTSRPSHFPQLFDYDGIPTVPLHPGSKDSPKKKTKKKRKVPRANRRGDNRRGGHGEGRQPAPAEESSAESGQESDQEGRAGPNVVPGTFPQEDVDAVLAASYLPMDNFETKFALCESFAVYGITQPATKKAMSLLHSCLTHLQNGRDLVGRDFAADKPGCSKDTDTDNRKTEFIRSQRVVDTMEKALFLATVLRSSPKHEEALFSFVLNILQVPKYSMTTKFFQAKEYHLEEQLIFVLKSLHLGTREIEQLRQAADQATAIVMSGCIPPLALTHYIFDKLNYTKNTCIMDNHGNTKRAVNAGIGRQPMDDDLALRVSLEVLGARVPAAENDHPHCVEAVMRLKGELAMFLMTVYKDSTEKLGLVLDKLLDPHVHRMYTSHQSNAVYFLEKDEILKKHVPKGQRPHFPYADGRRRPIDRSGSTSSDSRDEEVNQIGEKLMTAGSVSDDRDSARSSSDSEPPRHTSKNPRSREAEPKFVFLQSVRDLNPANAKRWRMKQMDLASERHANYMGMLARRLLQMAGGNQNNDMFVPQLVPPMNHPQTQRNLHMCALLVGIYSLGVHNKFKASPTAWQERTYSTLVSWISAQMSELGTIALEHVRRIWESHFKAGEVAAMADKAGQSPVNAIVMEGANLALSVLPSAHHMLTSEVKRAIDQCKEQGLVMYEKALNAFEQAINADTQGRLTADTLFYICRRWEELHNEHQKMQQQQVMQIYSQPPPQHQPMQVQYFQQPPPMIPNPHHQGYYQPNPMYAPGQYQMPPVQQNVYMNPNHQNHPMTASVLSTCAVPTPLMAPLDSSGRLHQSQSAPQLTNASRNEQHQRYLFMIHRVGVLALQSMVAPPREELRPAPTVHPNNPHADDIMWVYCVSRNLGVVHAFVFLDNAVKGIQQPKLLHRLLRQAIADLPCQGWQNNLPHPPNNLGPRGLPLGPVANRAYTVAISQARQCFLANGWHHAIANLWERCMEQYYVCVGQTLGFSSFKNGDREEAAELLKGAYEVTRMVPGGTNAGNNVFDDFIRHVRKHKPSKRHDMVQLLHTYQNYKGGGMQYPTHNYSGMQP